MTESRELNYLKTFNGRCHACGQEVIDEGGFHTRSEDDGKGNEIPVQCGPVSCLSCEILMKSLDAERERREEAEALLTNLQECIQRENCIGCPRDDFCLDEFSRPPEEQLEHYFAKHQEAEEVKDGD